MTQVPKSQNAGPTPSASTPRVLLGEITGAHGIRGDLIIRSYTAIPAAIAGYGRLQTADGLSLPKLHVIRTTDRGIIARLASVTDRTAAERLKGTQLWIERARLPKPAEDEFYHADLIGLDAVAPDGSPIGKVMSVENFGAGDLIEIRTPRSAQTEFIPFTRACVPTIDIAARTLVIVRPPTIDGEPTPETPDPIATGQRT